MLSPKHLIGLILMSLLFVSCSPFLPFTNPAKKEEAVKPATTAAVTKSKPTSSAAKMKEAARVKANKEAAERRARLEMKKADAAKAKKSSSSASSPSSKPSGTLPTPNKTVVKPRSKYRTAMAIPGKPGFVFNPWTNKAVDARGVPGGQLIRDPSDGNPDHKFRVP